MNLSVCVCVCVFEHACVCVCLSMYACVCVCVRAHKRSTKACMKTSSTNIYRCNTNKPQCINQECQGVNPSPTDGVIDRCQTQ